MKKLMLAISVVAVLIAIQVGMAATTTPNIILQKINGTPIKTNWILHNASLKAEVPNIAVPTNPNPEELFKNSKALVELAPMFKVYGAGEAFIPYDNILVLAAGSTYRTPLFYDAEQKLFATISIVDVYNLETGKEVATLSHPTNSIIIFKVDPSGNIHVLQQLSSPNQGPAASVVLCPAGLVSEATNYPTLYGWQEMIYPNGSISFGAAETLYVYANGSTNIVSYGYFRAGTPSTVINVGGFAKLFANTTGVNASTVPAFDDVYVVDEGSGWSFAINGHFTEYPKTPDSIINTPDGYAINLSTDPWASTTQTGDIAITDLASPSLVSSGGEKPTIFGAAFIVKQTETMDPDVQVPAGAGYWVLGSNQYDNVVCLLNLESGSAHPMTGVPVKKYGHYTHPIYMSGVSTVDGKYVFLLKAINASNLGPQTPQVVLEIWEHDGPSLSLVDDVFYNLSYPTETTQPRTMASIAETGGVEILPIPGGLIFYNVKTHEYRLVGFNSSVTYSGRLAAVSPDGRYCVLGDTVYQINYMLNIPAIVYDGNIRIYNGAKNVYLGTPVVYKIPSDASKYGYVMRAISGRIKIGQVFSKKMSVNLITDKMVGNGLLWDMYKHGLIKTYQYTTVKNNGLVENQQIHEGKNAQTIVYVRDHVLKPWAPYIAVATVGSAVDIKVPLTTKIPITQMSSLLMNYSMGFGTIVPEYAYNKFVGFEYNEFGSGIGAIIIGPALWKALLKYAPKAVVDQIPSQDATDVQLLGIGRLANRALSKAMPIVGIAMIVDSIAGYFTTTNAMASTQLHTYLTVIPVFTDNLGRKYAAVTLLLPGDANVKKWETYAEDILHKEGIQYYVIQVKTIGANSEEYQHIIATIPKSELMKVVDLKQAYTILMAKYGASLTKLKLTSVHLVVATLTEGRSNLWDWVTGGYRFQVLTLVTCKKIEAQGVIPAETITSPQEICDVLNPVYVNGVPVNFTASPSGAVATFMLPAKCQYVNIQVNKPYYAAMEVDIYSQLIAPLYNDKPGVYETNFTYSWTYSFNESKIMFIGMPYKLVKAFETVYTTHGNEQVDMTPYMSFMFKIADSSSPTGWRYYYGTTNKHDLRLIDPHDAGLMIPNKKYWIQYWYEPPSIVSGDASIHVMFNGTTTSSTLPRHARVIINSTKAQTVYGYLEVVVGYEDMKTHNYHTVDTHTFDFALKVGANQTVFKEWDIQKYVGEALHQYSLNRVGYVRLIGKITKAAYDADKTNDYDSLLYYPPSTVTKVKPIVLTLDILDAIRHTPIANASVLFDGTSYTTNANGMVNITTTSGYHKVEVSANNYYTKNTSVLAYTNMTYYIYMIPKSAIVIPPNETKNNSTVNPVINYNNTTYVPLEVVVQFLDGMPVENANVSVYNTTTKSLIATLPTDGSGYAVFYVVKGSNVTINVTDTALNYTAQKVVTANTPLIVPFTLPINSKYYEPEVAVSNVTVWISMGLGQIPGNNGMSPVYQCVDTWFYTNTPQNITFKVWFVNTKTNETISSRTFTVHLHRGTQKVRVFVPVNVSDFTTCQVFCEITKYQYDTNPYNNMVVGNVVTFRPWVDVYPTIIWYPVKQKTPYGLLPGDTIKVCIGVNVPKGVHLPDVHVNYKICSDIVGKHKMKTMQARTLTLNSLGQVTTIWYNYTLQLPWTDKVVVNATVNNKYDLAPDNNNFSVVIPLNPDAKCVAARVQSIEVSGGAKVPVRVLIKCNYVGIMGSVTIIDTTDGNKTIGTKLFNITSPEQSVIVEATAPKVKKISEQHEWMAYVSVMNDVYSKDDIQTFTVTIFGVPSWIVLVAIFLFVMLVLLIVRHLLTIRPPRQGRYFKRVDGGSRDSFGSAKIHYRKGEGKFFRKIK